MFVDFHAHILPCADHGSDSVEMSLNMLKRAVDCKVDTIIATPHFYMNSDNVERFLQRRESCYNELETAAEAENINISIVRGAEVTLQVGLDKLEGLEKLCIENTCYLLLEMPTTVEWTKWTYEAVARIRGRGIEPVIAHIDRYEKRFVERLLEMDVVVQINAESVSNFFIRQRIKRYIAGGLIHVIGSDTHMDAHQYDYFEKAKKVYGADNFRQFNKNARRILQNKSVL